MSRPVTVHRVFISHGCHDNELVRDIARRLREAGFEPLVAPKGILGGSNWKDSIRREIRRADVVLFLLTPDSIASDWTMTELGIAEGLDRRVLPVTVGLAKRDLPDPLKTYQTVPFHRLDTAIHALSESTEK